MKGNQGWVGRGVEQELTEETERGAETDNAKRVGRMGKMGRMIMIVALLVGMYDGSDAGQRDCA